MKHFLLLLLSTALSLNAFAQDAYFELPPEDFGEKRILFYQGFSLDVSTPQYKNLYLSLRENPLNTLKEDKVEEDPFVFSGVDIAYGLNFLPTRYLSFGAVTGISFNANPNFSAAKMGANLTFFLHDHKDPYAFIEYAAYFPISDNSIQGGNHFKLGVGLPLVNDEHVSLIVKLQYAFDTYDFKPEYEYKEKEWEVNQLTTSGLNLGINVKLW